ncbi:AAA family ATPase [Methanobacterium congolense]|uniref:ATPase n=1 Tax=Methanobacterium congolense TaxID=118062 RepID=A0A1D3L1A6_9EURY|nr:ATP-binding protein [Methanobacterium congolense]SCG85454.1 ATPase [Methanobacterium congolense]
MLQVIIIPILPLGVPSDLERYFYNREKDLKRLKNHLNALNEDVAEQILITGYRGVGKTFLLKKMLNELPDNILVSYIDISRVYGNQRGNLKEELIMQYLLNSMNEALKDSSGKLKNIYNTVNHFLSKISLKKYDFKEAGNILGVAVPEGRNDYEKLSKFVMEFPQKVVESSTNIQGFVIVIDKFQLIGELENPSSFFWLIRSYTQNQDNVSYIFTGSVSKTSEIIQMINGQNGAFGGRMIQVNIDPFTQDELQGYLNEKVGELKFTEDGFRRFYECTRGIPAYINSFCNTMSSGEVYNSEKIKETFFEKMDQITVMWIQIWGTLSIHEKEIVISIVDKGPQKWNDLLKTVPVSRNTLAKYLDILKNKGIVVFSDQDGYKIEEKMLEAWIKHKKKVNGYYPP